jgi:hypothetical protein
MPDCTTCRDDAITCAACGGSSARQALLGAAGSRGVFWAAKVARLVGLQHDWPPFAG